MKTPMNVFNTAMKKKNKNRKGFSLVELIVCLVIMAILAAALVPTLIGYIKQTRQSNAKNEAASAVSAAQTIGSSAFADPSGVYHNQGTGGDLTFTWSTNPATVTGNLNDVIVYLAEVNNGVSNVTYSQEGVVQTLDYTAKNGQKVEYRVTAGKGAYTMGTSSTPASTTT